MKGRTLDVVRLRESFAQVSMHGDELPLFFYSDLFIKHPEVRELFPIGMATQRGRFVDALIKIVANADRADELTTFLRALGRDHRKFGALAEHYGVVGASLMATLEHFCGPTWTPEVAADWQAAYDLVSSVMIEAARADEQRAAALVAGQGRVPRAEGVRRLRAVRPAGVAPGLPAGAVGVDRDAQPPEAVALLLHGERPAFRRAAGVPRPADRRRRGEHGADQRRDHRHRRQAGTSDRRPHAEPARLRPGSADGRGQHRPGPAQGHPGAGGRAAAVAEGAPVLRRSNHRGPVRPGQPGEDGRPAPVADGHAGRCRPIPGSPAKPAACPTWWPGTATGPGTRRTWPGRPRWSRTRLPG